MTNHFYFNFDERSQELAEIKANEESRSRVLGILGIEDRNLRRSEIYSLKRIDWLKNEPKSVWFIPWEKLQGLHGSRSKPFVKAGNKRGYFLKAELEALGSP